MKPLSKLQKEDIKDIKIICFDVDGVTVPRGTEIEETETHLEVDTHKLSRKLRNKMIELKKNFHITISSGRSLLYLTRMFPGILWENASLTAENGVFTLIDGLVIQHEKFERVTLRQMRDMVMDLTKLRKKNKDFTAFEPKQFIITVHAKSEIQEVYNIVNKNDPNNEFYCIWNGEAFDIAPKHLNKGLGLKNLAKYLRYDISQTMAIGNGSNDKDMIDVAGIGVTTDQKVLPADYYTSGKLHLGGEELVDKLLELSK